jgi:hypothetical protein
VSTAPIPKLTRAIALTGTELLEVAQVSGPGGPLLSYVSRSITVLQLIALIEVLGATGPTGVLTVAPSVGANNDFNAGGEFGPLIGFLDLVPIGNFNMTGLQAGFDGQIVIITNKTAFIGVLNALSIGSEAPNRFRLPADLQLTQNNGQAFKYSVGIGLWVPFGG